MNKCFDLPCRTATFSELSRSILQYCHVLSPYNQALSSAIDTILKSFRKVDDDELTLTESFPWQVLIDTVISSLFEDTLYHSNNGMQ